MGTYGWQRFYAAAKHCAGGRKSTVLHAGTLLTHTFPYLLSCTPDLLQRDIISWLLWN